VARDNMNGHYTEYEWILNGILRKGGPKNRSRTQTWNVKETVLNHR
jgi:hypothetical protein